jgi:hypothetical protein
MNGDFIEALLLWNEKGSSDSVSQWLQKHGLTSIPMKTGLLITGTSKQFENVFSVDLKHTEPPLELPVPAEFKEHVASIVIPKRRQPYS